MDNETTQTEELKPVEYIVKEKSLVGNRLYEEGEKCMYAGLPAENLQPTCAVGEARYQEYLVSNAERIKKMREAYPETNGMGDPAAFAAAVGKAIAEANAEADERMAKLVAIMQANNQAAIEAAVTAALAATNKAAASAKSPKGAEPLV